jgi:hypothetical protein
MSLSQSSLPAACTAVLLHFCGAIRHPARGSLGTLIGADLLNLGNIRGMGETQLAPGPPGLDPDVARVLFPKPHGYFGETWGPRRCVTGR